MRQSVRVYNFREKRTVIALRTNDVMKFQTPLVTQTNKLQFYKSRKGKYVNGE